MVIAVSTEDRFRYVCQAERGLPAEEQTVFLLRSLTSKELALLDDGIPQVQQGTDLVNVSVGSMLHKALRAGLTGWENLLDAKGQAVEPEFERCNLLGRNGEFLKEKSLDRLPREVRKELGNAIYNGSFLTEEDSGN